MGQQDGWIRPSGLEIATSWVHGSVPAPPVPEVVPPDPLDALRAAVLPFVARTPCVVTFSGGRDSSAVLAVATDVARREGLPDPVPVTNRYPDVADTDETRWQELVVGHLGLREWVRRDVCGANDLVGPAARASLLRRGLLWPSQLHVQDWVMEQAAGGSLLTGEGGDLVLGTRRVTPLAVSWRRRRLKRPRVGAAVRSLAPRPVRRRVIAAETVRTTPWLTPHAASEHSRLVADVASREPLAWDAGVRWLLTSRPFHVATRNQGRLAAEHDVRHADPLLDPAFIHSLAALGGRWGLNSRTAAMRVVFGDLLPDAVHTRNSKASFNGAYVGEATRELARSWDGTGVDTDLVDAERLREAWLSDTPTARSSLLLQAVWLARQPARERDGVPVALPGAGA